MTATLTIEEIDKAIDNAMKFQSMSTPDGETVTNPNIVSLMRLRDKLRQEEALENGTRTTFATFDLSEQNF